MLLARLQSGGGCKGSTKFGLAVAAGIAIVVQAQQHHMVTNPLGPSCAPTTNGPSACRRSAFQQWTSSWRRSMAQSPRCRASG